MTAKPVAISGRLIGPGEPPFVIAEMSANHAGSLDNALALVKAVKKAGADALKVQTYTADTITIDHEGPDFMIEGGLWDGKSLYALYEEAHTPWDWHQPIFEYARELGLIAFSSPFDNTAVDFLEDLEVPAYKVASFELVDHPLIERIAKTGKPVIMSTGMADIDDIEAALQVVHGTGNQDVILLHCVSGYPAPIEDSSLRTIPDMTARFKTLVGLSDHTPGTDVPVAAVSLGACVIEKHACLRRADGGPDSSFSLEPDELARLVDSVKNAWLATGQVNYTLKPSEEENVRFRRSLYAVEDIKAGERITPENVRSIRPGFGLAPKHYHDVLKRTAKQGIPRGTPLSWDHLDED